MELRNVYICLIVALSSWKAVTSNEVMDVHVVEGGVVNFKCMYPSFTSKMAMFFLFREKQDVSFARASYFARGAIEKLDGSANVAMKRRGILVSKVGDTAFKFTFTKATIADETIGLRCEAFSNGGMGSKVWSKTANIKVTVPPSITLEPNKTRYERTFGNSSSDIVVKCIASGRPQPMVKWTHLNSRKAVDMRTQKNNGKITATLRVAAAADISSAGEYQCKAEVDSQSLRDLKKDSVTKVVTVAINHKPTLKLEKETVHTDLGRTEKLKINVGGDPKPSLNCSLLEIKEPKRIRLTPLDSGRLVYEVTFEQIQNKDVGEYQCVARNKIGTATASIFLTLEPSTPKILSGNSSRFSDYYQLHWRVESGARMHNVSVEVRVKDKKRVSKLIRTDVFSLGPNERSFRHHIANLTDNTEHQLHIKACNSRGCSKTSQATVFRTQKYNGANTVDPNILQVPFTIAPKSGKVTDENDATAVAMSKVLLVLTGFLGFMAME